MDMMKIVKAIRFANTVNKIRNQRNKALATFSAVTHNVESAHEAGEVARHIVNKEVSRDDLHYVIRIGRRHGPSIANRVYARYMRQRALEAQEDQEEEEDGPETA